MAIFCIGDIHGKFDILAEKIKGLPRNSHLLCVGDIGIGFEDSLEPSCLYHVNGVAAVRDISIWMIRGNHDNPYNFREDQPIWNNDLSNIKLMADVDSLELEGNHIVFVGGAISVDRSHEGRIDGLSWWADEPVHESAPSRVYHIIEQFGPADLLITHAGPITTLPVLDEFDPNIYHYSAEDPELLAEINKERLMLSDCVQFSRAPMVVYGHYHVPLEYHNSGVDYRCVEELEIWEFINAKSTHLPQVNISEDEIAMVNTMPIKLIAPKQTAKVEVKETVKATAATEDVSSKELIKETEVLRQTAKVSVRPPIKPVRVALDEQDDSQGSQQKKSPSIERVNIKTTRQTLKSLANSSAATASAVNNSNAASATVVSAPAVSITQNDATPSMNEGATERSASLNSISIPTPTEELSNLSPDAIVIPKPTVVINNPKNVAIEQEKVEIEEAKPKKKKRLFFFSRKDK